ncbi:MAG TPA: hypothetical protein VGR38_05280, partial [Candidatus Polarisedimenticolia bacterium]|nr:hypothetical protein [Candidatus Polarisedimenticolia bacterium]
RYWFTQVGAEVEKFKIASFSAYVQVGGAVNYDPARPVVGDQLQVSAAATLKPGEHLTSEFLYLKARLTDRDTGERFYDQDIARNRTVLQFTRNIAARTIFEYDTFFRQFSGSLLFSYTPHPNTALYLGYSETGLHDVDPLTGLPTPGYSPLQRTLFMKLSYNFRLETSHRGPQARAGASSLPRALPADEFDTPPGGK